MPVARRVLANVPVYMIFDDHDVTDDWNLSKDWEERAYQHPFSRRIIPNALIGYLIFQGWGNAPSRFSSELINHVKKTCKDEDSIIHDELINTLLGFNGWNYVLNTEPPVVVMDTRTRRWPSTFSARYPSGLLNQEGLDELEDYLHGKQSILLISSAPIFSVKLIEVIQRVFTWCGLALLVDAENWMSHKQTAHRMLGIFQHQKTAQNITILSGDVHYSFAYDVRLRRSWRIFFSSQSKDKSVSSDELTSPNVWQITSSGIKNEFPDKLIKIFDRLNRIFFAGYSPLNMFTQRRRMRIRSRRPGEHMKRYRHQRLVNSSNIGVLRINADGQPEHIAVRSTSGEHIVFMDGYQSDWH